MQYEVRSIFFKLIIRRIKNDFDERIEKDLTELYEGKEISSAVELKDFIEVSTKGLPQHFVGDRNAKTVFVQLNPGQAVALADKAFRCLTLDFDKTSKETFIESYIDAKTKYGEKDKERPVSFDVKQAAFLKYFEDSGIDIPAAFPEDKSKELQATENILMQKCQLELVPYCSATFSVNKKNMTFLQPYLETLIDEIFRIERKYVIFGGAIFADLFDKMNCEDIKVSVRGELKIKTRVQKRCTVQIAEITKGRKTINAVLARTFPRQDIGRAYDVMAEYGKFCFEELNKVTG